MRFRLSVTQIRILLIVGNLVLAGGVFGYAGYSFIALKDQPQVHPPIDLRKIAEGISNVAPSQANSAGLTVASAAALLPPKPTIPTEVDPGEKLTQPEPEPVRGPDEMPLGPLGEGERPWEYIQYIWYGSPEDTFVVLRKRPEPGATGPRPATRTTPIARGRVVTSGATGTRITPRPPVRPGQQGASDRISFFVNERVFRNAELELDFMIHSADEEKLVYWEPDKPGKFYALPYVKPRGFLTKPEAGLRPVEDPVATADGVPAPKSPFEEYDENFARMREAEYRAMLEGAVPGPALTSLRQAEDGAAAGGAGAATPGATGGAPGASATPAVPRTASFPSSSVNRRPPTAEEQRKLQEVFRSPNMTPEQRAQIGEAVGGGATRTPRPPPGVPPQPPAEAGPTPEPEAEPSPEPAAEPSPEPAAEPSSEAEQPQPQESEPQDPELSPEGEE